jgi:hypothetical protein
MTAAVTLTADEATQRWPAGACADEQEMWAAIFTGAERDGFTGTVLGHPVPDSEGKWWQVVFYFEDGEVEDRHLSQAKEPQQL